MVSALCVAELVPTTELCWCVLVWLCRPELVLLGGEVHSSNSNSALMWLPVLVLVVLANC